LCNCQFIALLSHTPVFGAFEENLGCQFDVFLTVHHSIDLFQLPT